MERLVKLRRADLSTRVFDTLYPQTVTTNTFRDDGTLLEDSLNGYDRHLISYSEHLNRVTSTGTSTALKCTLANVNLVHGLPLLLTLHVDLDGDPTLSYNGATPAKIIGCDGFGITGGQVAGSSLLLVWNEDLEAWVLLNNDIGNNITRVLIPVESEYSFVAEADGVNEIVVPGFNRLYDKLELNFLQTILVNEKNYRILDNNHVLLKDLVLRKGEQIDCKITKFVETVKQGIFSYFIDTTDHVYTAAVNGIAEIDLPLVTDTAFSFTLNYNQTILRNTVDYTIDYTSNKIKFLNGFTLRQGEQIVITVTKYTEAVGVMPSKPYSTAGSYRYAVKVIHEQFTAQTAGTVRITIPNFNVLCDEITVIKDNLMLVRGVDYELSKAGELILFREGLDAGETLYFTILQGAVVDVPTYATAVGESTDGQHWNVDISHSELSDMYSLVLRLSHDMIANPDIKFTDGPALPIVDYTGAALNVNLPAGSYINIIFDQSNQKWYCITTTGIEINPNGSGSAATSPETTYATGEDSFIGGKVTENNTIAELKIAHGLGVKPTKYGITPCEPPVLLDNDQLSTIGDYWVSADESYLYVGNTGTSTSKFTWFAEK